MSKCCFRLYLTSKLVSIDITQYFNKAAKFHLLNITSDLTSKLIKI